MTAVYILLGVLGLILLLLLLPVRVGLRYQQDLRVWVGYGPVKFRIYPSRREKETVQRKGKPDAKRRSPQKKTASVSDKLSEIADNMKRDSLSETLHEVQALLQLAGRTARQLLRAVTVSRLHVKIQVSAGEAAGTAVRYGQVCSVLFPALATLEQTLRIRNRQVEVTPGFGQEESRVWADIRVRAIPLRLLFVALMALLGFVKWTNDTTNGHTFQDEKG